MSTSHSKYSTISVVDNICEDLAFQTSEPTQ